MACGIKEDRSDARSAPLCKARSGPPRAARADDDPVAQAFVLRKSSLNEEQFNKFLHHRLGPGAFGFYSGASSADGSYSAGGHGRGGASFTNGGISNYHHAMRPPHPTLTLTHTPPHGRGGASFTNGGVSNYHRDTCAPPKLPTLTLTHTPPPPHTAAAGELHQRRREQLPPRHVRGAAAAHQFP